MKSAFNGTTLSVLQALIASNPLKGKDADAEKPFKVGLGKLARRAGRDQNTVIRHIQVLVAEKLVTVTKGKGTVNIYRLHLSPMKEWMPSDEADKLKRQLRAAAKLKWKHKDKAFKADLENIYIVDGCVKGAIKGETNRERRLRQYPLVTVQEIPAEKFRVERKPSGKLGGMSGKSSGRARSRGTTLKAG